MLSDADMVVGPQALGAMGPELGRGGQATVHLVPHLRLADSPGELAYKQYRRPTLLSDGVLDLIRVRNGLSPDSRSWLDRLALWPVRAVVDADRVVGVVMPRIDAAFMHDIVVDDLGTRVRAPRESQWLMVEPQRMHLFTSNPPATTTDRIGVCRDLAEVLRLLHESGIVFGDVSPKNVLWRPDRLPTLRLLDCDSALSVGTRTDVRQLNTPDWEPPEGGRLNEATDRHKLGLFVLRVLAPGRGQAGSREPERARPVLGDVGTAMLAAALAVDPSGRPTAVEWFRFLAAMAPVAPPTIRFVSTDDDVVVRGRPVVVRWEVPNATEIDVLVLDGPAQRVAGNATSATVSPMLSGPVRIVARNGLGEVVRDSDPVIVLDPPAVVPPAVPAPLGGSTVPAPPFPALGSEIAPAAAVSIPLPAGVMSDLMRPPFPGPDLPAPGPSPWPVLLPDPPVPGRHGVTAGGELR